MIVFATAANWIEPVTEKIGFLTDILRAYDDTEQRIRLRASAAGAIAFRASCMGAREASKIEAALWAEHSNILLVPWWPDSTPLLSAVSIGATALSIDATDRDFIEEKRAILWRDDETYEEVTISDILSDGSLSLQGSLDNAYPAGTEVIPLKRCRLDRVQRIKHPSGEVSELDLAFTTEPGEMAEYSGVTPTQYQGFDLLDEVTPAKDLDEETEYSRSSALIENRTGARTVDDHSDLPTGRRVFRWFANGRDDIAKLKRFIHRRQGQAVPFWLPTYRMDLPLAEAATGGGTTFEIEGIGYSENQFPDTARRHIAFVTPSGSLTPRKVTDAHENTRGNETITVSSALPASGFPATTMVSFLTLVRLASDDVEIAWANRGHAEADLQVIEVTKEVPA